MKLYYGGCGIHYVFVVAKDLEDAKKKIGIKLNAAFLPIEADEIDNIDGYSIVPDKEAHNTAQADAITERHCKKCDFTCESQGELLKHYREEHPKEA